MTRPHIRNRDGARSCRNIGITSNSSRSSHTSPCGVSVTSATSNLFCVRTPQPPRRAAATGGQLPSMMAACFPSLSEPEPEPAAVDDDVEAKDDPDRRGRSVRSSSDPLASAPSPPTLSHGSDADESVRRPKSRVLLAIRRSVARPALANERPDAVEGESEGEGDAARARSCAGS